MSDAELLDSQLIWKYLSRVYPDDHQVIYLYACGNVRSPSIAVERVIDSVQSIFCPPMKEHLLKIVIKAFLEYKKKQHINGEIKIKPIYGH